MAAIDPDGVTGGEARSLGRALSLVERGGPEAEALLAAFKGRLGHARTVGITGAPGVGKSTLAQALGSELLATGARTAVLAVDPSSPFSGGALLGDRVRMPEFLARGGFVRSMATRGALGGLAVAASDALDVLDAAGFDWVLVETVGVGQDEVEIAGEVETVVLVAMAGQGDEVQAAKAGVMEIADVFVVNKADLPGAGAQLAAIEGMLELGPPQPWRPPVVLASAATGDGVAALAEAIAAHRRFLEAAGQRDELRRRRARRRVERLVTALVRERIGGRHRAEFAAALEAVGRGSVDPYAAARRLVDGICGGDE